MDAEKLRALQIAPDAKTRSQGALWWIFLGVALVSAVAIYFAWPNPRDEQRVSKGSGSKSHIAEAGTPPSDGAATNVSSATPSGKVANSILTVSGYIVNRERIEVSPRFLGQVKWIGVRKGDTVTNDQVLVLLDDAEQRARVAETEGRLANARAAVTKAELDYNRIQRLITDKIETEQTADDARLRLEGARATLKEVEGVVALAKTYLDWTVIRSPINGVVLEKLVDAAELVTPQSFGGTRGPSTALLAIADPKDLQVEIDLNESDVAKIFKNQECKVSPEAYPDKIYAGYVAEIAPEANRQKGTLQVKVQIRDPDQFLTPELSAKVDFIRKK